jgi:uncharacterized repeat protein (TIGR02543 family)
MTNAGTETVYGTRTVTFPATTLTDLPAGPSRNGHVFEEWNTQANGLGTSFTSSTTVNGDITVYAQWTVNSYTVTFMMDEETETVYTTRTVTFPATAITDFPPNPTLDGYSFAYWWGKWTLDGGGQHEGSFTASTPVTTDITAYAVWTAPSTVTFMMNDGTEDVYTTRSVMPPGTAIADFPADPTRSGYIFAGWNTLASGWGITFTASTTVSNNRTVYAQWDTYSYTVTFNSDGGTAAVPTTKTVATPATTINALPAQPSRTGYSFEGWYTEQNGEGTAFTAQTTVTSSITVYAKWYTYSYTVTFNSEGGTAANPATKTVALPATTVDSLPNPPIKTGYLFGGWHTEPYGGGNEFTATTTVSDSITVYARWDSYSYLVTFDNNGGDTAANPATKPVDSPATTVEVLPAQPAKTGYNFAGWNTAANGSGIPFTASTTVSGSITVHAQWTYEQFDITLNLDAGDGAFSETNFTISKSGSGYPVSRNIAIAGTGYTNPRWYVDENLKGTDTNIGISAANYNLGGHTLALFITKGGVSWSKEITFTVTN